MPFQKGNDFAFKKGNVHGVGKAVIGKVSFENNLAHKIMRQKEAILAKCYDCMGFYEDGTMDCGCSDCPLHFWMPYRGKV